MRSDTQHIEAKDLQEVLRESGVKQIAPAIPDAIPSGGKEPSLVARPLGEQVAELERQAIQAALAATGGNKVAAAKMLGISRAKLYERLAETV